LAITLGEDNKFLSPLFLNFTEFKTKRAGGVWVERSTHLDKKRERKKLERSNEKKIRNQRLTFLNLNVSK
jgi:hypothetical protein